MTGPADRRDEPRLVVPAALDLPDAARDRLARQYARRPAGVDGVAAAVVAIPPGSSTTTAADWAATAPIGATEPADGRTIAGAVLVGPEVEVEVGERGVTITATGDRRPTVVLDRGAAAFDPDATDGEPRTPAGDGSCRPPFRRRPVTVLLAGRPDALRAAQAAALADGLLAQGIEARLALAEAVAGPLRTAPVPAERDAVAALGPDCLVLLDEDAAERAEQWSPGHRGTTWIQVAPELGDGLELVPWTIDRAEGRLRARIGPSVDAAALAAVVQRLCAGPLPGPPTDDLGLPPAGDDDPDDRALDDHLLGDPGLDALDADPSAAGDGTAVALAPPRRPTRPRRIAVVPGPSRLLDGLVDHLRRAGHEVVVGVDGSAAPVDLVLAGPGADVVADPGRPVVAVLTPGDGPDARVPAADAVVTDDEATAAEQRAHDLPVLVLPRLRTGAELAALERAGEDRVPPAVPTVAVLGDVPEPLAEALAELRDHHGEVAVVPADADDRTDPVDVASWTVLVWPTDGPAGRLAPAAATAALAGVPVVTDEGGAAALEGIVGRAGEVTDPADPGAWRRPIDELVDPPARSAAAAAIAQRARAVHGGDAAELVIDRLLGWVDRAVGRPGAGSDR